MNIYKNIINMYIFSITLTCIRMCLTLSKYIFEQYYKSYKQHMIKLGNVT